MTICTCPAGQPTEKWTCPTGFWTCPGQPGSTFVRPCMSKRGLDIDLRHKTSSVTNAATSSTRANLWCHSSVLQSLTAWPGGMEQSWISLTPLSGFAITPSRLIISGGGGGGRVRWPLHNCSCQPHEESALMLGHRGGFLAGRTDDFHTEQVQVLRLYL